MEFLLDSDVIYLNHGSFGATPKVVFETYQRFQRELERDPVRFLQREMPDMLAESRTRLGEFIGCAAKDIVLVANPTFATNTVARSLKLSFGDEVLTSNHEYGACRRAWHFVSEKRGFRIVEHEISLPVGPLDQLIEDFWSAVTPRTKVIFLSHITSPTALQLPVEAICERARAAGILTVIDGAHVPGQRPLDLSQVGADFYMGACHKWLCAPKGASFFYAHPDVQAMIEPLIIGWGWGPDRQFDSGNEFQDSHFWLGTRDLAAYLSIPAAIDFQKQHDWPAIQQRCHQMALDFLKRASEITGIEPVHRSELFHQMALLETPQIVDAKQTQRRLYDEYRIEVPIVPWGDRTFIRVSVQAYNSSADLDALVSAVADLVR